MHFLNNGITIVYGDPHQPYTCPDYEKFGIYLIRKLKAKKVVLIGDNVDAWDISKYCDDPWRDDDLFDDIQALKKMLLGIIDAMEPGGELDIIEGNHCARLAKFVAAHCKKIKKFVKTMPELLELDQIGKKKRIKVTWHPEKNWSSLMVGDCLVTHGVFFDKHVATNNHDRYWDYKKVLHGHVHRTSLVYRRDRWMATIGCGAKPKDLAFRNSPVGADMSFAILHTHNGITDIELVPFINGRGHFRGALI